MRPFHVAIATAALAIGGPSAASPPAASPLIGQPAPEFELTLVDGSKVRLSELRGQVVVLNFWATWCVPCRAELPLLDGYYRATSKHGLRVFAVTTENSLPLFRLKPLFATLSITPVRQIKGKYDLIGNAVPTNYIIDRRGVVRYAKAAALDLDDLNANLVPLLREAPPS
jgi:peroxiredoxin